MAMAMEIRPFQLKLHQLRQDMFQTAQIAMTPTRIFTKIVQYAFLIGKPEDWDPAANPDALQCGQTITQTKTYNDLNNCGIADGKPADESQEVKGTLCQAQNAFGTCQADGTCSFTCNDGYQKDDNGVCQPIEPPAGG